PLVEPTFVQYSLSPDPDGSDKVVPDLDGCAVLWAARGRSAPIALSGELGADEGVTLGPSAPTAEPTVPETPAPGATDATPGPEVVELPGNVSGSKADQATCSVGRG
ncbi:transcriptional regulator, partial [Microbacterium testaceum]